MKYFPYKLVATANGWSNKGVRAEETACLRFERACVDYKRQLASLQKRIPTTAWKFFRYAIQDDSLHDATLIRMTGGDAIADNRTRPYLWYRNTARTRVRLEFLNHMGDQTRVFECIDVRRLHCDLFADRPLERNLGDVCAYELRASDKNYLTLGFLFASGGEIEIEFRKLSFQTQRHPGARFKKQTISDDPQIADNLR